MAERITTTERRTGAPTFQPASLQGQAQAAQNLGTIANLTQQRAENQAQMVARVTQPLAAFSMKVGEEAAQERGMRQELPPMRDQNGDLVPYEPKFTLNLQEKVFQKRASEAWAQQAQATFTKKANELSQQFQHDPKGYEDAMGPMMADILAKAPYDVRPKLEHGFTQFALGKQNYIQAQRQNLDMKATTQAIESNSMAALDSARKVIVRAGTVVAPDGGMHPDLLAEAKNAASIMGSHPMSVNPLTGMQLKDSVAVQMNQVVFTGHADAHAKKIMAETSLNPMEFEAGMEQYERDMKEGRIRLPGWEGNKWTDEPGFISYQDMNPEQQQAVDRHLDNLRRGRGNDVRFNVEHTRYQERQHNYSQDREVMEGARPKTQQYAQWKKVLDTEAVVGGVDPLTAEAMLLIESGANPVAVSQTGVQGLMQVTGGTAVQIAADMQKRYPGQNIPQGAQAKALRGDPEWSIRFGIHYLKMLGEELDSYGGKDLGEAERAAAIAIGYNRGPKAMQQYLRIPQEARQKWMSSLETTHTMGAAKRAYDEDKEFAMYFRGIDDAAQGTHHARKLLARRSMLGGGVANYMAGRIDDIATKYGDNPDLRDAIIQDFTRDVQEAERLQNFTQGLFYAPPTLTDNMVPDYLNARMGGVSLGDLPGAAQQWLNGQTANVGGSSPVELDIQEFYYKAAAQGMRRSPAADIGALVQNPIGSFEMTQKKATELDGQVSKMFGSLGVDPLTYVRQAVITPQAQEQVAQQLYQRATLNGHLKDGSFPRETQMLMQQGIAGAINGDLSGPALVTVGQLAKSLFNPMPRPSAGASAGITDVSAQRLDAFSRLTSATWNGPDGKPIPKANVMAATTFLARNAANFADPTKEDAAKYRQRMEAILYGKIPDNAYQNLDEKEQKKVMALAREQMPSWVRAAKGSLAADYMKVPLVVDKEAERLMVDYMAYQLPKTSEDTIDLLPRWAAEQLVKEKQIGWSVYGAPGGRPRVVARPLEALVGPGQDFNKDVISGLGESNFTVDYPVAKNPDGTWKTEKIPAWRGHPVGSVMNKFREEMEAGLLGKIPEGFDLRRKFTDGEVKLEVVGSSPNHLGFDVPHVKVSVQMAAPGGRPDWRWLFTYDMQEPAVLGFELNQAQADGLLLRNNPELKTARNQWYQAQSAVTASRAYRNTDWWMTSRLVDNPATRAVGAAPEAIAQVPVDIFNGFVGMFQGDKMPTWSDIE